jgi:hypothetical protein
MQQVKLPTKATRRCSFGQDHAQPFLGNNSTKASSRSVAIFLRKLRTLSHQTGCKSGDGHRLRQPAFVLSQPRVTATWSYSCRIPTWSYAGGWSSYSAPLALRFMYSLKHRSYHMISMQRKRSSEWRIRFIR